MEHHKKNNNLQNSQNQIEIHTKDNRMLKITFPSNENERCIAAHSIIEGAAFLDINGVISPANLFQKGFPYQFKLDVNDNNWVNYIDGWSLYADIRGEIKRMGIDLENNEQFRIYSNEKYQLCRTYPSLLIVPKMMTNHQVEGCSKFRTKSRLPALTYYHKESGTSIWRSS